MIIIGWNKRCTYVLTLKDGDEGLGQLVRQQRFWQLPEVLLDEISHVKRLLTVEIDIISESLGHHFQFLYPRLDAAFPKDSNLIEGVRPQPSERDLNTLW